MTRIVRRLLDLLLSPNETSPGTPDVWLAGLRLRS